MSGITFRWKTSGSGNGGCPALAEIDAAEAAAHGLPAADGYLVVGIEVTEGARDAYLEAAAPHDSGIAATERIVYVPADVLDRLSTGEVSY